MPHLIVKCGENPVSAQTEILYTRIKRIHLFQPVHTHVQQHMKHGETNSIERAPENHDPLTQRTVRVSRGSSPDPSHF